MSKIWSKEGTLWSLTLYGTTVGAGTLLLPIQLDSAGAIVLFTIVLAAWPPTYWPRKVLSQLILSANIASGIGITGAVNHYYDKKIGNLITGFHSLALFVVVLIYAVAIINSLAEQAVYRTPVTPTLRTLLSLGVVLVLDLTFLMGRQVTIKVMGSLVFPLIACFLFPFPYLICGWHPEYLISQMQLSTHTLYQVWISVPVMVSVFSHTPIISTSTIDQQEEHGDLAVSRCKKIMEVVHTIIYASVLFFVFSCLLAIPATYIGNARDQGMATLSTLSMVSDAPGWLVVTGTIAVVVAMSKSFLGTYFEVIEGASEIVKSSLGLVGVRKSHAFSRAMSILLISAFTFAVCFIDPNAISMTYAISGSLIAMILFIIPMLPTWLISTLKPYRPMDNAITSVVGLLCVSMMSFG